MQLPHSTSILLRSFCGFSALFLALALAGCAADQHHRSGISAIEQGDYAKGVAELRQASELAPQDIGFRSDWLRHRGAGAERLLGLADNAIATGRAPIAEQYYLSILTFDGGNARATAGLERLRRMQQAVEDATQARAALAAGDTGQAAQLAARALEADPNQVDAKAVRREIDASQAKESMAAPAMGALYKKPINLEFRDASLKMIFDALTRTTGINFIFDRDVKADQRSTVFLRQTSLEDAVDVLLSTNQLGKKILNANSVLIYPNTDGKSREYQDLVVRAFYLATAEAKQTASMLKTVLKIKDVYVDDKLNMLVLREPPDTIALAEKLISLQDLDQPEVMLEMEVLEVNRSRLLDMGIQLSGSLTVSPLNTTDFALNALAHLNSKNLGVTVPSATLTLNAINRDANLLANPRIRVHDREKAKFMIGDKVPVVTTTNTPNGFSSENIQYQDVGLKVEVEPDVHLRDEIGLKLSLEVSSLVSSIKTNNGSLAYQIGTRSVSTVLRLKDGETQVLAGLISDEDRKSANGLPYLNELPVLGHLFSGKEDNHSKTEIVLSITPHLVRSMQRREFSAESFWSGTEAGLRLKPLQLRTLSAAGEQAGTANPAPAGMKTATAVAVPGAVQLRWIGQSQAKVGVPFTLELRMDSPEALRAAPLQLAFNPEEFEVLSVHEGDYFGQQDKANFNASIDKASGRVSVGMASNEAGGAQGERRLLTIEFKPLRVTPAAEISVLGMTPIGNAKAAIPPGLPITHTLSVAQ